MEECDRLQHHCGKLRRVLSDAVQFPAAVQPQTPSRDRLHVREADTGAAVWRLSPYHFLGVQVLSESSSNEYESDSDLRHLTCDLDRASLSSETNVC